MMITVKCKLVAAALSCILPMAAAADPLPRSAKIASPQKIAKIYSGKTELWTNNCGGGIYFGPGGQARAWCADQSENLGAGTWSVDANGQMCQDLVWYYPSGRRAGASASDKSCISHVVDAWGVMWRSWPNDPEWWPMGKDAGLVRGYKFQTQVRQTRSKLGF
ncbi:MULTISPECIES: DUF995 domain-containing protein [Phaeobacter]|nr:MULTISPECIES: DUF995 domain-containing protein [Phaeobacter]MBQ4806179.1 DUF995 domain-containing protein [Phaeobacter sp. HS012]MBQ4881029.1 DUF995 domain-containing protein [Phaeobacter sp. HS011]UWR62634.1 DUF995 domain-containing protein [Phaeobacter inhibens]UWS02235.1 DUF995 domain-containing protein [Phaeobacter inhibens]